jgi:hypothetical protein
MPLRQCRINNEPGYAWGKGKCYSYDPSDEQSKTDAKKKAITQAVAIGDLEALAVNIGVIRGTYDLSVEVEELVGGKVSYDYDGVLTTKRGKDKLLATNADIYIITARSMSNMYQVYQVARELRVPRSRVISTGSNQAKIDKIKELGIRTHWDNNPDVIKNLPGVGRLF